MTGERPALRFAQFEVHPIQGLTCRGRDVHLSPKSLAVLYALVQRPDRIVTKAELFDLVWPRSAVSDAALSSCIREIRVALGERAGKPRYIETVHRRGYRLRSALEGAVEMPDEAVTTPEPGRTAAEQPSIAILLPESIGLDAADETIVRGLAHDIITRLARSRAMLVIARGTAFKFVSGRHDPGVIGKKLGVRYVVQGAVQRIGNKLRVYLALADTVSRRELWSEHYDLALDDLTLLQDEAVAAIVSAVEAEVQRDSIRRSLLMSSDNLDAWSAFHRGLDHMYRFTTADTDRAEELFLASVRMDPNVPRPYAGLSFIHFERVFLNQARDRDGAIDASVDYALRSLAIDPLDPMGHWALSRAYLLRGELDAAKAALETSIELNPSYAIAQYSLGWVGMQIGMNQLCLDKIACARRLSPYDPLKFGMLGVCALNLALMGRTEEAIALSSQSTLQPNAHHLVHVFAALTHALGGDVAEARGYFGRVIATVPNYGIDDFLAVFAFQREQDRAQIEHAFAALAGARQPVG